MATLQGRTVDDLKTAFRESIDDYPEFCKGRGEAPDKPYSGRFLLRRVDPALHRKSVELSADEGPPDRSRTHPERPRQGPLSPAVREIAGKRKPPMRGASLRPAAEKPKKIRSGGRCLFVMPDGTDLGAIEMKISPKS
jgi:hypothetical protein